MADDDALARAGIVIDQDDAREHAAMYAEAVNRNLYFAENEIREYIVNGAEILGLNAGQVRGLFRQGWPKVIDLDVGDIPPFMGPILDLMCVGAGVEIGAGAEGYLRGLKPWRGRRTDGHTHSHS